ncbi:CRM-domain containing factor CFM3, chloroplastic/mitochondrial-like [Rutidosis leptorrhynchoides]|uniref:CRM-domain containing factor CFM3, chloroplastic/mitochondrial-like n=1 Tax=Rutidosis leptorrhynchoides TaxID=125765 RepID=UPI003A998E95
MASCSSSSSSSPFSLNFILPTSTPTHKHSSNFKLFCSNQIIHLETHQINPKKKTQRKPRPSFSDQVLEKWSRKPTSLGDKFPWQQQQQQQQQDRKISIEEEERVSNESRIGSNSVGNSVSFESIGSVKLAPWVQKSKPEKQSSDFENGNSQKDSDRGKIDDGLVLSASRTGYNSVVERSVRYGSTRSVNVAPWVKKFQPQKGSFDFENGNSQKDGNRGKIDDGLVSYESRTGCNSVVDDSVRFGSTRSVNMAPWVKKTQPQKESFDFENGNSQKDGDRVEIDGGLGMSESRNGSNSLLSDDGSTTIERFFVEDDEKVSNIGQESHSSERVPWVREKDLFQSSSNTPLADKLIPEFELKRLRNKAGRMVERFRVGAAGVTQELVDAINEKWKTDEVVKLKFKGPSTLNMKRIHESLESRTSGIVIWRSGSSVVLFRGMAYKLPCVQSFTENKTKDTEIEPTMKYAARYVKDLSEEELLDLKELNLVLDGLGPRFKDWSGREPLPIDADLLPSLVEGYRRPYRLLPYGTKPGLRDKEMTFFRRTARTMPPHFALGRNRDLQGLAVAMTKLWERSAIAKIAIKRGVHNTCNERMAEELKRLTGGTLVSRNKDFIVFYRGNDFLPSNVTRTLTEAQDLSINRQEDEDKAREKASTFIDLTTKNAVKGPLVAGTLAETMAATSKWGIQPSSEEIEKMRRDLAVARHTSLVRLLQNKLALANGNIIKAEKALGKVQEHLRPSELPTDLETLTDEERFSLRKIGLSMKPFLELGRRGVFDGTIENMHLHWKYRELVKIMVERKSFAQVKHVAISLEAESGGVLVSVDKTTKGYAIIVYRGKNYERPDTVRPKNLLTRRKALARAIELQRREALKHHMLELSERIRMLKQELEDMKSVDEIDEETLRSRMEDETDSDSDSDDHGGMVEDEEAYLETYKDDQR